MLVPGVGESVNRTRLIQDGYYTTAIVTEAGMIILHGGRFSLNRRQSGGVHVEYTVSGTVYHNRIRIRHNRVYVGQEVRIYYDSGNPNNITPVDRDIAIDTFVRSIPAFILSAFIILWGVKCIKILICIVVLPELYFHHPNTLKRMMGIEEAFQLRITAKNPLG